MDLQTRKKELEEKLQQESTMIDQGNTLMAKITAERDMHQSTAQKIVSQLELIGELLKENGDKKGKVDGAK